MKVKTKDRSVKEIGNEMETFMSEIRTFARLSHKHIVRYNNSWIEVELEVK